MATGSSRILRNETAHKADKSDTAGQYSLLEVSPLPGEGPPLHSHANEDEGFYVLKGTFRFWIGDAEPIDVYPGTYIFGPRNIPHRFQNISETNGKMLLIFTPPGYERYFIELAIARVLGGPNLIEEERAIDRKYGITMERVSR